MDTTNEKSCLEEISGLVFDALQKVTLKTISNNWLVSNDVAQQVLTKWLGQNEKKMKELVKEFFVRGINTKGKISIAVVDEETKKRLEAKWKEVKVWLYSVETKSNSRDLKLTPPYEEIKVKNILYDCGQRDLQVPVPVKQEVVDTTKIKTPFGMVKPVKKEEEKKPVVPKEKPKEEPVEVKKEQPSVSPKKASPPSTSKPSTAQNKKNGKQPAQKGNISSFFSKNANVTKKEVKQEPLVTKKEPSPEVQEEVASSSRKRSASPPPTSKSNNDKKKPPQKKPKLKEPKNKKRSRIQVMEDSSEEEEEETNLLDEPESKLIKFDREETPEPKATRTPSPVHEEKPHAGKHKAKRWVTKRFETDDGFIRTEKVLEEYSASEDETVNDENRKKNSPPAKSVPEAKSPEKKSKTNAKSNNAKANGTAKTKQGSIMSFFTKK